MTKQVRPKLSRPDYDIIPIDNLGLTVFDMETIAAVLFADDDRVIRASIANVLQHAGYRVIVAKDGAEAVELHRKERPDLVLLDVGMPKRNGREACEDIRNVDSDVPILFYTAFDEDADQIAGLGCGADDFISKDASPEILLARISSALRRKHRSEFANFMWGEGTVNVAAQRYVEGHHQSSLTIREIEFLRHMSANEGAVISKDALLTRMFGIDYSGDPRALDKMIERLRSKLFDSSRFLTTIPRQGLVYSRR